MDEEQGDLFGNGGPRRTTDTQQILAFGQTEVIARANHLVPAARLSAGHLRVKPPEVTGSRFLPQHTIFVTDDAGNNGLLELLNPIHSELFWAPVPANALVSCVYVRRSELDRQIPAIARPFFFDQRPCLGLSEKLFSRKAIVCSDVFPELLKIFGVQETIEGIMALLRCAKQTASDLLKIRREWLRSRERAV